MSSDRGKFTSYSDVPLLLATSVEKISLGDRHERRGFGPDANGARAEGAATHVCRGSAALWLFLWTLYMPPSVSSSLLIHMRLLQVYGSGGFHYMTFPDSDSCRLCAALLIHHRCSRCLEEVEGRRLLLQTSFRAAVQKRAAETLGKPASVTRLHMACCVMMPDFLSLSLSLSSWHELAPQFNFDARAGCLCDDCHLFCVEAEAPAAHHGVFCGL